jgi:3-carboxy-cis,cis-muconate cycloisomerase
MVSHLHGELLKNNFTTEKTRNIFNEDEFISKFLRVEAALAKAEAKANLIPDWAASKISDTSSVETLPMNKVKSNIDDIGLFSMSIIEAWKEELGEAGEYIHWGASTQDISDTAVILQLRDGTKLIFQALLDIRDRLSQLARTYRDTPIVGRTQHVNAPPVTFGLKFGTWLDEIERHVLRLQELNERLYVVQLAGASGTLASIENNGVDILENFAEQLNLDTPDIGWTSTRDRFAELLNLFSMISGTTSRIAQEILFLNRPEINEVDEFIPDDELGSSTNPHKRNPVLSQHVIATSRLVRGHSFIMNESLNSYNERDRASWYVEFAVLPESVMYLHRALINTRDNLRKVRINNEEAKMNISESGQLISSEAVMIALAESIGRQSAHEIIHEITMSVIEDNQSFKTALLNDQRVVEHLSVSEIQKLTNPLNYTGLSTTFVDRVLESIDK